ncbi:MAG: S8 family serine peptidase [Deltaproteobacteria bacterium]|nr:S8 family serine peptidase [Deltaproteobacteria bacterium]MBI3016973.1 S8 family serine peptidase [Deltaproteobacteria bacterium]
MKRALIVSLYFVVILLILSTNQSRWFHPQNTKNTKSQAPLINQAIAFTPTFVNSYRTDPQLFRSWALTETSPLELQKAWSISQGNKRIVVAVIDTGVDYTHSDLKNNIWQNPGEIPNNGKDDDGNGFIDDMMGWNFVANDPYPADEHGHGTHVAGIIGAVRGNGIGISGVCPNVSLMILKYYSPNATGKENLENTIKSFRYAVQNGAHIINYSGGGAEFSKEEREAILEAKQKGIIVVAAAGNERQNADIHAYYPASYDLDNIISVAALTPAKKLVDSSNYGIKRIDVAAPGQNIYSTLPKGQYGYMTGTSQATAFVTGVAALALSTYGTLPSIAIKNILLKNTQPTKSLQGKIKTGGMVNAYAILKQIVAPLEPVGPISTFAQ